LTDGQVQTHSHGVTSLCISDAIPTVTSAAIGGSRTTMQPYSANSLCDSSHTSTDTATASGYAFAQLRTCVVTTASGQVPINTVAQFDSTVSTCPTGWSTYTAANGRFIIPLDATNQAAHSVVSSTASAMTMGNSSSTTGTHTHSLSTTYSFPQTTIDSCCSTISHDSHGEVSSSHPVSGTTGSKDPIQVEIPWVNLLTCIATVDVVPVQGQDPRPPQGSMIYMAASSCATGYERVSSNFNGRIIIATPASGTNSLTFGGTPFSPPAGVSHTHTITNAELLISNTLTSV
jgi:hypothetical protein